MHHSGRILFAGFDSAQADIDLTTAGTTLDMTIQTSVAAATAEIEQALLQAKPYQIAVLHAEKPDELRLIETARALHALDASLYLVLAVPSAEMPAFRAVAATLGEHVFVMHRPLRDSELDLLRVLIGQWHTNQALAEMRETTAVTQRAYKLVDGEFRRQNARLLKQEQEMAEQSALLEATLDSMRQGLLVLNADLRVTVFNGCVAGLIGYSTDVLRVGVSAYDLIAAAVALGHYPSRSASEVYETWRAHLNRRLASSQRQSLADGRELAVNYAPMSDGGWVITYDDITDRIHTEEALEEQHRHFGAALRNMPHGLCMFDDQKRLILCNAAYGQMYALPTELIQRGTPLQRILDFRTSVGNDPADISTYFDVVDLAKRKDGTASTRIALRDGRTVRITHNPMSGGGYVATHEDVTDSIRADAQIAHMAHHDALTGLPNRLLLRERAEDALARLGRGAKLTMLCLDLDHFKAVNDTLGHPIGDLLLQAVAGRLQGCVRQGDTVARVGGDEFVIVQTDIENPQQADALARRFIDAVREPFDLEGHQVVVSASVGVAFAPDNGDTADRLLKNADTALYRAKSEGSGLCRFFESAMDARLQQRRLLELDLRRAFLAGDFQLHYQPIVDAQSEDVIGVEALLRWKHATRGMVSPVEFIPVAEAIGLIVPLGEWVIRQACTDAAKWPKHIKVAVNLSPAQFVSQTLVHTVVSALADSGLSPHRLEMEITESVLLADNHATLATLHHLRDLGVRIAMDDFGTGYSSLSYLRSFPFDKIKIDRSFVSELGDREDCTAIVKAVAGLGANLGMATTAEGVETAEQLRLVREQGCTEIQGYYFSPARPFSEISRMLRGEIAAVA